MRNIAFSLLILLASNVTFGQETELSKKLRKLDNDTILYVKKEIIFEKQKYIGKPLDSLLKDLPMQPKTQMPLIDNLKRGQYIGCYLFLYNAKERDSRMAKKLDPLEIGVTWKTSIKSSELKGKGIERISEWSEVTYDFYKTKVIKDIVIVDYKLE